MVDGLFEILGGPGSGNFGHGGRPGKVGGSGTGKGKGKGVAKHEKAVKVLLNKPDAPKAKILGTHKVGSYTYSVVQALWPSTGRNVYNYFSDKGFKLRMPTKEVVQVYENK